MATHEKIGAPENINPLEVDEYWEPTEGGLEATELVVGAEVEKWVQDQKDAIRKAGSRGTWEGRRDLRGRSHADRFSEEDESATTVSKEHGRYAGRCKIPPAALPRLIEREYGEIGFQVTG